MKVIRPITITPAMITYNSAPADAGVPVWNSATAYPDRAIVKKGLYLYQNESATTSTNQDPEINDTVWLKIGPTNEWAMYDEKTTTTTDATLNVTTVPANPGYVELILESTVKTGSLDSVALFNLYGDKVSIKVTDGPPGAGETIVYPQDLSAGNWSVQSLIGDEILDWYQYFFVDYAEQRTQVVFRDIPGLLNDDIHVTFRITAKTTTPATLAVAVGNVVFGTVATIGGTNYGMTAGVIDYSIKETDEFGETVFVPRDYSKRITAEIQIPNKDLNRVQRTLYNLRAKPAVWIAADNPTYEEAAVVFGFYRDFSTSISYPTHSMCSVEIEGLI